jgi:hypothetical protein
MVVFVQKAVGGPCRGVQHGECGHAAGGLVGEQVSDDEVLAAQPGPVRWVQGQQETLIGDLPQFEMVVGDGEDTWW